ncbi:hypothetical protein ACMGDH_05120 [Sphingomonas sp. DT-207]|uniref:hypothetical protein n=1 Tax=Sphingomonas sp. DT-207 TaxID=3396167 RepID=UPI003F1C4821
MAISGCARSAVEAPVETGAEPPPEWVPETAPPPEPAPEPERSQLRVLVQGTGVSQFHYLRSDFYASAGTTDAAKRQFIQSSGAYGPWQIDEHVAVLLGDSYVFIPECGGSLRLASRVSRTFVDTSSDPVRLACPQ